MISNRWFEDIARTQKCSHVSSRQVSFSAVEVYRPTVLGRSSLAYVNAELRVHQHVDETCVGNAHPLEGCLSCFLQQPCTDRLCATVEFRAFFFVFCRDQLASWMVNGLHCESSVCIREISPALSFAFVIIFGRRHRVEEIGTAVKRCHSIDTLNRPSNRPWCMISVLQRLEDENR